MFEDKTGKKLLISFYKRDKMYFHTGILESVKIGGCAIPPDTLYHLKFKEGEWLNLLVSKVVDVKVIDESANGEKFKDFLGDNTNFKPLKFQYPANDKNYANCGTFDNRPRDLQLPYVPYNNPFKKEIMKVKVQTIIEAAIKSNTSIHPNYW
jgi:hypothetical protein